MDDTAKKKKIKFLILVPVLLLAALVYTVTGHGGDHPELTADADEASVEEPAEAAGQGEEEAEAPPEEPVYIFVDVGGAVNEPRVVSIPAGSRVFQAIEAAGGQREDAQVKNLNLAEACVDGQKIYVPTAEEAAQEASPAAGAGAGSGTVSTGASSDPGAGTAGTSAGSGSAGGRININTASSEELQTLSGIGPSMAQRIIEYRTSHGSFQSVDDLQNVSGIGEKTMEKLRENICI